MKYKIVYDAEQDEDVIIIAKTDCEKLKKIEAILNEHESPLIGYFGGEAIPLDKSDVYAICIESGRVYAMTEKRRLVLKARLYVLEKEFSSDFVKINQSCLINIKKIKSFGTSIGASLTVTLKNGYTDYVSRRQVKAVKERFGL